jgi:hypothetical protein
MRCCNSFRFQKQLLILNGQGASPGAKALFAFVGVITNKHATINAVVLVGHKTNKGKKLL